MDGHVIQKRTMFIRRYPPSDLISIVRSFASRLTAHFLDNLSALDIILRYTAERGLFTNWLTLRNEQRYEAICAPKWNAHAQCHLSGSLQDLVSKAAIRILEITKKKERSVIAVVLIVITLIILTVTSPTFALSRMLPFALIVIHDKYRSIFESLLITRSHVTVHRTTLSPEWIATKET